MMQRADICGPAAQPHPGAGSIWAAWETETARTMWAAGASGGVIAAALGTGRTRSAVMGFVHRQGWTRGPGVPLADVGAQACRWPLWTLADDWRSGFKCCGAKTGGGIYCAAHTRKASRA